MSVSSLSCVMRHILKTGIHDVGPISIMMHAWNDGTCFAGHGTIDPAVPDSTLA